VAGKSKQFLQGMLATAGLLVLLIAPVMPAEDTKPRKTKGISLKAKSTLALGSQIPELKGYSLQIRTIVLTPGAVAGHHSHVNRPVVAYLVSGDYTEHRDGQGIIVHKPGEQWLEGAEVSHWSENRGVETTYLINVEVFRMK